MKLTFVDASVLIAAARGGTLQSERAMSMLGDSERQCVPSPLHSLPWTVLQMKWGSRREEQAGL